MERIETMIMVSMAVLIVLIIMYFLPPFISHRIEYIQAEEFNLEIEEVENTYTKQELKAMVERLFENPNYTYIERDELSASGFCRTFNIIPIIEVKKDLSYTDYPMTLAHELVHAVYYTGNERFANLKAFELLYNSGNDYLRYCALKDYQRWLRYELSGKTQYFDYCYAGNVKF